MKRMVDLFKQQATILRQRRELAELRAELDKLQQQNDSMRQGMRRCTTCEYRIDYKMRQGNGHNND